MIRCLIKNRSGFTSLELILAVSFSVLLFTGVYGYYNTATQSYSNGITAQNLQDAANVVLTHITEGSTEPGGVFRLSTAVSYMIPTGATNYMYTCGGALQALPCTTNQATSELYYCQNTPCSQTGGVNNTTARWYYLNPGATAVIYHHPATGGGTVEQTIFTAPAGSTLILRFEPAAVGTPANVVEIDVAVIQGVSAKITNTKFATNGSASTFVLLRNHQ